MYARLFVTASILLMLSVYTITIQASDSERVDTAVREARQVAVEGPFGNFVMDDESTRPLIMVALDEGIAPVKSLIEHAINLELRQRVLLFWLVSREDGHYLDNYCRSWKEVLDNYSYTPLRSPSDMSGEKGDEVGPGQVLAAIDNEPLELQECDIYLSGTTQFNSNSKMLFAAEGVPESRIFSMQMRREDRNN